MSQEIIKEVIFLGHSFLLGVIITFIYDGFIILRKLIKHAMWVISLEDLIFWIVCAIGVFYTLCEENNGILRWFAIVGAALGMFAYKKTISPIVVNLMAKFFSFILGIVFQPLRFLLQKTCSIKSKVIYNGHGIYKYLKKKLTAYKKALKMILCKH